jgi:hypothetical protein
MSKLVVRSACSSLGSLVLSFLSSIASLATKAAWASRLDLFRATRDDAANASYGAADDGT